MKLVTFQWEGKECPGVVSADGTRVTPVSAAGLAFADMNELILGWNDEVRQKLLAAAQQPAEEAPAFSEITLLAPIPEPRQDILCLGINYMAHAYESAKFHNEKFNGERPYPVYFSKRICRCTGPEEAIDSHQDITQKVDYEAELGVILARDARDVSREQAMDYVFGYTILNDVSARDLQNRHKQFYFGKSLDTFAPMGPWIVTADELTDPTGLAIRCRVNGELRQDSDTGKLLFDIPYIISEWSAGTTLKAGTIISTGTPSGVGVGMDPPCFLKAGDVVECEIEGIGVLRNPVR